jgi:hypothetical protein
MGRRAGKVEESEWERVGGRSRGGGEGEREGGREGEGEKGRGFEDLMGSNGFVAQAGQEWVGACFSSCRSVPCLAPFFSCFVFRVSCFLFFEFVFSS